MLPSYSIFEVLNQGLGLLGYGLILLSLFLNTQHRIFIIDLIGCLVVALHFVFLEAYGGALLSVVYGIKDLVGLIHNTVLKRSVGISLGLMMLLSPLFFQFTLVDGLALTGSLIALAARISPSLKSTFFLIAFSTVFWGIYGFLVGSIGQVLFSCTYATIAIYRGIQTARNPSLTKTVDTLPPV